MMRCLLSLLFLLPSTAMAVDLNAPIPEDKFPHLSNWETRYKVTKKLDDGMCNLGICGISKATARWLETHMANGALRPTTPKEMRAWEARAKEAGGRHTNYWYDCGRSFTILKPISIPAVLENGTRLSGGVLFLVAENVPFPDAPHRSKLYDMNTGGWYFVGQYFDGEEEGSGDYPHSGKK